MALLVTDAVVLHAFDYLETSRIFRLLTRDAGVQSVLAKGVRRSRKRFGSALDLFAGGAAQIHTRVGRDLNTLAAFDVERSRSTIALDLGRFTAAAAIGELALRFAGGDSGRGLYDAVTSALDELAEAAPDETREAALAGAWRIAVESQLMISPPCRSAIPRAAPSAPAARGCTAPAAPCPPPPATRSGAGSRESGRRWATRARRARTSGCCASS